jgi:hypothetical protein
MESKLIELFTSIFAHVITGVFLGAIVLGIWIPCVLLFNHLEKKWHGK